MTHGQRMKAVIEAGELRNHPYPSSDDEASILARLDALLAKWKDAK